MKTKTRSHSDISCLLDIFIIRLNLIKRIGYNICCSVGYTQYVPVVLHMLSNGKEEMKNIELRLKLSVSNMISLKKSQWLFLRPYLHAILERP